MSCYWSNWTCVCWNWVLNPPVWDKRREIVVYRSCTCNVCMYCIFYGTGVTEFKGGLDPPSQELCSHHMFPGSCRDRNYYSRYVFMPQDIILCDSRCWCVKPKKYTLPALWNTNEGLIIHLLMSDNLYILNRSEVKNLVSMYYDVILKCEQYEKVNFVFLVFFYLYWIHFSDAHF